MSTTTRNALLSEAEDLVRTRGYSAFSYADLAERVGIRKASIHHHFPTKEELGVALIDEYLIRFRARLMEIKQVGGSFEEMLRQYADLFVEATKDHHLPLCGALAAEINSMPEALKRKTQGFFDLHTAWLTEIMEIAESKERISDNISPKEAADLILGVLEGASVIALAINNDTIVIKTFNTCIASILK